MKKRYRESLLVGEGKITESVVGEKKRRLLPEGAGRY